MRRIHRENGFQPILVMVLTHRWAPKFGLGEKLTGFGCGWAEKNVEWV
jgi:hypothetical protein